MGARRSGRRFVGTAQIEGAEEAKPEPGEQQRGAGLEGAGRRLVQDLEQQAGDQRHVDLDAHGILAAPPEAADLEVLLEPFEQQLDLPALLVEPGDLGGRASQIVSQESERLLAGALDTSRRVTS